MAPRRTFHFKNLRTFQQILLLNINFRFSPTQVEIDIQYCICSTWITPVYTLVSQKEPTKKEYQKVYVCVVDTSSPNPNTAYYAVTAISDPELCEKPDIKMNSSKPSIMGIIFSVAAVLLGGVLGYTVIRARACHVTTRN